jgi:hypothetical protein
MKNKRALLLVSLILAGCGVEPLQATPFPTPVIWDVTLDPALDWLRPYLNACTQSLDGVFIVAQGSTADYQTPFANTFDIAWGSPVQIDGSAFILGWDELAVIVNEENPILGLSKTDLTKIFEGNTNQWAEVPVSSDLSNGEIHVWTYPSGNTIQRDFEDILNTENYQNPFAGIAPNPQAMMEAVRDDPQAIGFLPERWIAPGVKKVEILELDENELKKPILVIAGEQPGQEEKGWLLCVMDKIKELD